MLAAVFLLVSAGLVYLQQSSGSSSAELAALSQSVPNFARAAVRGEDGAYDQLGTGVTRLAELRRAAVPGASADWQSLVSRASAILSSRDDVEAMYEALTVAVNRADAIVQMSDGLLDSSGSTAIMQQFQQRADNIRQLATSLAQSQNAASATAIEDHVVFLRSVAAGLAGEGSQYDIRPLGEEARDTTLTPILGELTDLEGPLYEKAVAAAGKEEADRNVEIWRAMVPALEIGELCPHHLRGRKPG